MYNIKSVTTFINFKMIFEGHNNIIKFGESKYHFLLKYIHFKRVWLLNHVYSCNNNNNIITGICRRVENAFLNTSS